MEHGKESYLKLIGSKRLKTLFFILFSAVTISILFIFRFFFWPFLFALVLYIALKPVYDFIFNLFKRKLLCSSLMIFSIILFAIVPFLLLLLLLADQAHGFYLYLQHQFQTGAISDFIQKNDIFETIFSHIDITQEEILQQIISILSRTSMQIFTNVTALVTFSLRFIMNLIFVLLILFFLFKDGDKLSAMIYGNLPFPEDIERNIVGRLKKVIRVLFTGNIFIMTLQGLVVGIALWSFGFRMPLLWATLTSILSLIPAVGTMIIWVPAMIYLFVTKLYLSGIILGLWCFIGYLVLENVVKVKVFGKRLNFHPLIFFFLLIGSIQAFNLPGVIIGPILLTLFFSLWELYKIIDRYGSAAGLNEKNKVQDIQ